MSFEHYLSRTFMAMDLFNLLDGAVEGDTRRQRQPRHSHPAIAEHHALSNTTGTAYAGWIVAPKQVEPAHAAEDVYRLAT